MGHGYLTVIGKSAGCAVCCLIAIFCQEYDVNGSGGLKRTFGTGYINDGLTA